MHCKRQHIEWHAGTRPLASFDALSLCPLASFDALGCRHKAFGIIWCAGLSITNESPKVKEKHLSAGVPAHLDRALSKGVIESCFRSAKWIHLDCDTYPTTCIYFFSTTYIDLSNIWLPEHWFVKISTLVRLKTIDLNRTNPLTVCPQFLRTRSSMRYDISFFVWGSLRSNVILTTSPLVSFPVLTRLDRENNRLFLLLFLCPYGNTHRCRLVNGWYSSVVFVSLSNFKSALTCGVFWVIICLCIDSSVWCILNIWSCRWRCVVSKTLLVSAGSAVSAGSDKPFVSSPT